MRPRTLVILATMVGALLALIYFAEDKVASTDERAAAAKRLVDLEADEVVTLEIAWQGNRVRFERAPAVPVIQEAGPVPTSGAPEAPATPAVSEASAKGAWRIVEPFAQRADEAAVSRLLATLAGLEAARDLDGAVRGDVGLDPPRGTVTWKSAKAEGRLEIGGAVPASHDVVVAATGRRALAVTSDGFLTDLARPAGEWRSREVVAAGRERIVLIAISSASGAVPTVFAHTGATLRLQRPVADVVDRDLAERLLSDLSSLRMETFLDPPLAPEMEKALAEPAGTVELTIAGESAPLRIEVGGATSSGKRVWRAGDQVFESASVLAEVVTRPASDWRSRNWTRFENWRIEKARVEEGSGAFELTRSNGEWLRDGKKIPFAVASELLAALTSAKAESLVERPAGDSTATPPPKLAVTLSDADGNEEMLTLFESRDPAAAVPARTRGRAVELLLPRDLVTELEKKVSAVRAAAPSPPDS